MVREKGGNLVLIAACSCCLLLFALLFSALFAPFDLLPFHSCTSFMFSPLFLHLFILIIIQFEIEFGVRMSVCYHV